MFSSSPFSPKFRTLCELMYIIENCMEFLILCPITRALLLHWAKVWKGRKGQVEGEKCEKFWGREVYHFIHSMTTTLYVLWEGTRTRENFIFITNINIVKLFINLTDAHHRALLVYEFRTSFLWSLMWRATGNFTWLNVVEWDNEHSWRGTWTMHSRTRMKFLSFSYVFSVLRSSGQCRLMLSL